LCFIKVKLSVKVKLFVLLLCVCAILLAKAVPEMTYTASGGTLNLTHSLTVLPGWAGCYTCPALTPYQFDPMRVPECNHKVTGNSYKAVDGCETIDGSKADIGVKAED